MKNAKHLSAIAISLFVLMACSKEDDAVNNTVDPDQSIISALLNIDLSNPLNYANQDIPNYINKDNTPFGNSIDDQTATLGRVLFYDVELSSNRTVSCSSCHQQSTGFSSIDKLSQGVNGLTGRHSMRLINARFAEEEKFFWDERANNLEEQTTMPIRDHGEMGFSGANGDPSFQELLNRLQALTYYQVLFKKAYGDELVTEERMQKALSQFIRSIQSFDSKYDVGRSQVTGDVNPFPNFSSTENNGKMLFIMPPQFDLNGNRIAGGLGCAGCHRPPAFDIDPNSLSNGVVLTPDQSSFDFTITRSPSLRDVVTAQGVENGPFMHTGNFATLSGVIEHYNTLPGTSTTPNIDPRLRPNGNPQRLQMNNAQKAALMDFLKTLGGSDVYTNEKWSDPFK